MNESKLISEFNALRDKCLVQDTQPASVFLSSLTDHELTVYIAGKTYNHGRSFAASWDNASRHIKNREQAIYLFSRKRKI